MIVLLLIAGIGIFACGAAVVLLMLVYLLLFKIGCIVVFCLLPFGAFDKTAWIVDRPLGWVMSNGIRFLVLALVVGLLFRFADQATNQTLNTADGSWTELGNATTVALQLLLVNFLMLVFIVMANRFARATQSQVLDNCVRYCTASSGLLMTSQAYTRSR